MGFDSLRVIRLDAAFELVFNILKSHDLTQKEESMLEALILSCPQVADGDTSYILKDDLGNFCRTNK